jgi:hypothetical protein
MSKQNVMLNLFQHLTYKVYTNQSANLVGCLNKFGMTDVYYGKLYFILFYA